MTSVAQHFSQTLSGTIQTGRQDPMSGCEVLVLEAVKLRRALQIIKTELFYDVLIDLVAIDWQTKKENRFELRYLLKNSRDHRRLCLRVFLDQEEQPQASSVVDLYASSDWAEREVFDMMGVKFINHPCMERLLMWDEFEGHPLRKDYPLNRRQAIPKTKERLLSLNADDEAQDRMLVNLGPSHPAFHGALRTQVCLEGETIVRARSEIGYLHRCFEKHAEHSTYTQIIPYSDRLNYVSALMNNVGYCKAVEDLMGIAIPERAMCIRVLICELSRVMDHLVCVSTNLVDMGALTNFWYAFNARERLTRLIEKLTGARLTYAYTRIGGLARDLYPDFIAELRPVLTEVRRAIRDMLGLVAKNKIFLERTQGVGAISVSKAHQWGFTGPCLRACGVAHDLRKDEAYYQYETYDFDIPIGHKGDTYDRIMVRFEEMEQSLRIVEQCLVRMPKGPIMVSDRTVCLPDKDETYHNIEGLMNHFKLIMHGMDVKKGEVYSRTEAANGELGFSVISEGGPHPYRIKVRPPCFYLFAAYEQMIRGHKIADAVAILGSLNVVVGECDR